MTETELLDKALQLQGFSFLQLSEAIGEGLPKRLQKGWLGQSIEKFLGATSGSAPIPDFPKLDIELKTIPILANGKVAESTYVTTLHLLNKSTHSWEESTCYKKLKKVLWLPIEGERTIPYAQRRIGRLVLWSPNEGQNEILKQDWEMITDLVIQGHVERINGSMGEYLHIRPKARNALQVTQAVNEDTNTIQTLPRGFYLRTQLTNQILSF